MSIMQIFLQHIQSCIIYKCIFICTNIDGQDSKLFDPIFSVLMTDRNLTKAAGHRTVDEGGYLIIG